MANAVSRVYVKISTEYHVHPTSLRDDPTFYVGSAPIAQAIKTLLVREGIPCYTLEPIRRNGRTTHWRVNTHCEYSHHNCES